MDSFGDEWPKWKHWQSALPSSILPLLPHMDVAVLTSNSAQKDSWKSSSLWILLQSQHSYGHGKINSRGATSELTVSKNLSKHLLAVKINLHFFQSLTWYRDCVRPYSLLLIVGQPVKQRFESLNAVHSSQSHTLWIHPNRAPTVISRANPFSTVTHFEGEKSQKGIYHFKPSWGSESGENALPFN